MATGTTQFMHQKLVEETPIFSKQRVNFSPTHPLTHLAVANNNIVMAMANRFVQAMILEIQNKTSYFQDPNQN